MKIWLFELVSGRRVGWKGYPIVEPVAVCQSSFGKVQVLYPKGNQKNISCRFVLVCNDGLEIVEVYDWIKDRIGVALVQCHRCRSLGLK